MLPGLAPTAAELVDVDVSEWCDAEIRESIIALRRDIDRCEAFAARLVVAVAQRGIASGEGAHSTGAWMRYQTGQRNGEANASLSAGMACESMPLLAKAWGQGEISASAARTISRGRRDGHEDAYATMEERLVAYAAARDFSALDGMIRHYQTRCDELDHKIPSDQNRLHFSEVGGRWIGRGDYDAFAGATDADALRAAMDRPTEGDTRSTAKRRADASTRIHRFFLDHGNSPIEGGERPHLNAVVHQETDSDGEPTHRNDRGFSPSDIARLYCDARIARVVMDAHGVPLDAGRAVYTPSASLRRAIVVRDRHCRFPGCDHRASWAEIHHINPFPHGPTTKENCALFCDHHHHVLHRPGWLSTFDGTTLTITNPDGRTIGTTTRGP
jgi:hypothetical protein